LILYNASKRSGKEMVVGNEERLEKLHAEYETLDDAQKAYILGIAEALAFACSSRNAACGPDSPPQRISGTKEAVPARLRR
jgi:hypothetical protein